MKEVSDETLKLAYKPFDIVTDQLGNVGFIWEVNVNRCQPLPENQISYSVKWIVGNQSKVAWFDHNELKKHGNIQIKIAECMCHPFGNNSKHVEKLVCTGFNMEK